MEKLGAGLHKQVYVGYAIFDNVMVYTEFGIFALDLFPPLLFFRYYFFRVTVLNVGTVGRRMSPCPPPVLRNI